MSQTNVTPDAGSVPDPAPSRCGRCDGEMEAGFIIDVGHGSSALEPHWARGKFEKNVFGEMKGHPPQRRVLTYRCTRCGLLESYAP